MASYRSPSAEAEAEAERVDSSPRPTRSSLGPVFAGLLLDMADFATWGPLGLKIGLLVGAVAGWLLAPSFGVPPQRRWLCALVAGVYCMLPFTAFLPLGTVLGALVRLHQRSQPAAEIDASRTSAAPPIEAEYDSRWDDP